MLHAPQDVLLHVCCAPCATAVFEALADDFRITAFFYNPNIQPGTEYAKRLEQLKTLCGKSSIRLMCAEYDEDNWRSRFAALDREPEGGKRCEGCFELRLARTAAAARELGIATIATTLSISPHKNARMINAAGMRAAAGAGVSFLERDFKKHDGYRRSCELSRLYSLYRQNYCGCLYSLDPKKNTP